MSTPGRVGLIGDDLMLRSRVVAALDGIELVAIDAVAAPRPDVDALFVDLNRSVDVRVAAVAQWRMSRADAVIVGFCSHGEGEVRRQAMAAGADRVVTNGGLAAEARRIATGDHTDPSQ